MRKIEQIIRQATKIADIRKNFTISFDVQKSQHAGQRQYRHEQYMITQQQIIRSINKASDQILKDLVFDKLNLKQYFCIIDKSFNPPLNIVATLLNKASSSLQFIVVTIMRKKDFKVKPGTKIIQI